MDTCSYSRVTADSVIGVSGQPVEMYGMMIESAATAAIVILRNGTSATATEAFRVTGTASTSTLHVPAGGRGVVFPSGLFCDIDANTTSCTVFFRQNLTG